MAKEYIGAKLDISDWDAIQTQKFIDKVSAFSSLIRGIYEVNDEEKRSFLTLVYQEKG